MKRRYTLENLECANCAAKMEDEIKKLDGVNSVTVNFITTKMVLDVEDDKFDSVLDQAKDIIKSIEPYVEVK
ncbi:cation transporter [Finegoldia magna]|uniref:Cation transporter n=1 Tax=Finegoldia magna TaxID=1260 RepID=A0A233VRV6_FINMA|nr:cation transporter [Finegoldia magna]MBS5965603.1 cation transporter [Finegoldia magna]MDU2500569.1 cation transporter [Finegoldia magna]MDU3805475.1 cation transporter [Finegoldia magna]MDU4018380.1 cation transporter [Finegoldia magna]MDU4571637.1 cation transporter [Finegoldia magna]